MSEKVEVGKGFFLELVIPEGSTLLVQQTDAGIDEPAEASLYLDVMKRGNCFCLIRRDTSDSSKAWLSYSDKPFVNIWKPQETTYELLRGSEKAPVSNGQQLMVEKIGENINIYVQ